MCQAVGRKLPIPDTILTISHSITLYYFSLDVKYFSKIILKF